jgi:hypothetical protein
MFAFDHVWPYMGLGAALLLALLLSTDILRSDRSVSRWQDLVWLTWAGTLAYLLHQFEEHGIDAEGAHYAFRGFMCATLGFPDAKTCPVPLSYITSVNIAAVWLAGPAAALLGRRWPALALSYFSIPFINFLGHTVPYLINGTYNPGVLTAILVFLPLSLWAFRVALVRYLLGWSTVLATVFAGVILHAILLLSVKAYIAGLIGIVVLDVIQVINPLIAGVIVFLAGQRASRRAMMHG